MAKCPAHTERTGSLSIKRRLFRAARLLLRRLHARARSFARCSDRGLWPAWRDREEDDEEARRKRQERDRKAAADRLDDEAKARAKAARDLLRAKDILRESFAPTPATTVGIYLIARGIDPPWPACIRQHPRLYHRDGAGRVSHHPAMVCPIRDIHTDEIIGCASHLARRGRRQGRRRPSEEGARSHHRRRDQADARRGCDARARRLRGDRERTYRPRRELGAGLGARLPPATSQPSPSCPASRR